jgi:hypothetical protein
MNELLHTIAFVKMKNGGGGMHRKAAPKDLFNRIVGFKMKKSLR